MLYNSVGVSGWPIFTLLGYSITVWVCLGGLYFTLLGYSISVWVCLGGLFFTMLGCSITVWVCLGGLFLQGGLFFHCLDDL